MGELALNLALLVLTLALAVLGAVVGGRYQHRAWRNQHFQGFRDQRITAAGKITQDIARLIDRRLYRQRRVIWALRQGKPADINEALGEYRNAIFEWMDNLGRIKAELWQSFGRYTAIQFEGDIHDRFAAVGRNIEARVRGKNSGPLVQEERDLNSLGRSSYEFVHYLLARISQEDLVGLVGRDTVSYSNWDNLPTGFLIKRLFGVAT